MTDNHKSHTTVEDRSASANPRGFYSCRGQYKPIPKSDSVFCPPRVPATRCRRLAKVRKSSGSTPDIFMLQMDPAALKSTRLDLTQERTWAPSLVSNGRNAI